jgi:hypothetical protein
MMAAWTFWCLPRGGDKAASTLACGLLLLSLIGCGKNGDSQRHAISGTVLLGGEPLRTGSISFEPASGKTNGGAVIENGEYQIPQERGLVADTYRVRINCTVPRQTAQQPPPGKLPGPEDDRDPLELIPSKYNSATQLTAQITDEGPKEFDFSLHPRAHGKDSPSQAP